MKIGLDIAVLADKNVVDRLILVTADKDIIPAMKHGRKEGMQMVLAVLLGEEQERDLGELCEHADYVRKVESWPSNYTEYKTREEREQEE